MTSTTQIHSSIGIEEKSVYHDHLAKVFDPILAEFDAVMKRYAAFNLFFTFVCALEFILLVVFFAFLAQSLILALSLSVVFFTFFAYFTLRVYFKAKKPEQLKAIKEQYLTACKNLIGYREHLGEHHVALANACSKFANRLHGREYNYYRLPFGMGSGFAPLMEQLSCWIHWEDVHLMKEMMLEAAVEEHVELVKCQATNLEAHAGLANSYVMLSGLYIDPRKMEGYDDDRWIPADKYDDRFETKFRAIAERAIEEFKILSEYAPDDSWVHSQLAYSYHDMQMPLEEIKEYETIQRLMPEDRDNLYKLGILYFQQGMNAKGLRVYEELRKGHYKKAESLIKYYGTFKPNLPLNSSTI